MLREDEKQFVVESDGFVNTRSDIVANFEIFWSLPAANALILQVSMESLSKGLIVAGIRDEDFIVIDCFR
jgi:hypothetical protein